MEVTLLLQDKSFTCMHIAQIAMIAFLDGSRGNAVQHSAS